VYDFNKEKEEALGKGNSKKKPKLPCSEEGMCMPKKVKTEIIEVGV